MPTQYYIAAQLHLCMRSIEKPNPEAEKQDGGYWVLEGGWVTVSRTMFQISKIKGILQNLCTI